ncbi:MAG: hypothetical protein AAB580_01610 [Patescibacteria group bacterium]
MAIEWEKLNSVVPEEQDAYEFWDLVDGVKGIVEGEDVNASMMLTNATLDDGQREQLRSWEIEARKKLFELIGKEKGGVDLSTPPGVRQTGYKTAISNVVVMRVETQKQLTWYLHKIGEVGESI